MSDTDTMPSSNTLAEDAAVQLEHEITAIVREETGLKQPLAEMMAKAIVRGMRERLGGDDLYIPAPDRRERYAAIRAEFKGTNLADVCKKFKVSRDTVYRAARSR